MKSLTKSLLRYFYEDVDQRGEPFIGTNHGTIDLDQRMRLYHIEELIEGIRSVPKASRAIERLRLLDVGVVREEILTMLGKQGYQIKPPVQNTVCRELPKNSKASRAASRKKPSPLPENAPIDPDEEWPLENTVGEARYRCSIASSSMPRSSPPSATSPPTNSAPSTPPTRPKSGKSESIDLDFACLVYSLWEGWSSCFSLVLGLSGCLSLKEWEYLQMGGERYSPLDEDGANVSPSKVINSLARKFKMALDAIKNPGCAKKFHGSSIMVLAYPVKSTGLDSLTHRPTEIIKKIDVPLDYAILDQTTLLVNQNKVLPTKADVRTALYAAKLKIKGLRDEPVNKACDLEKLRSSTWHDYFSSAGLGEMESGRTPSL
jgi:hypothetical protein